MRLRVVHQRRRVWAAVGLVGAAGCATTGGLRPQDPTAVAHEQAVEELTALRTNQREQAEHIEELESRLALAQAESAALREEAESERDGQANGSVATTASVRIGGQRLDGAADGGDDWLEPWDEGVWQAADLAAGDADSAGAPADADADARRPVLRLYGTPPAPSLGDHYQASLPHGSAPVGSLADLPTDVPLRLPNYRGAVPQVSAVAAPTGAMGLAGRYRQPGFVPLAPAALVPGAMLPGAAAQPQGAGSTAAAHGTGGLDDAVRAYRAALKKVRDREFAGALRGFESFLAAYPNHPYMQHALYWRGEVLYALRAYRRAGRAFARLLQRFPTASKAPDALAKLAQCQTRSGKPDEAARTLATLRQRFPGSVAARAASGKEQAR